MEGREGEPVVLRCETQSRDETRVEWMNPRGEYLPSEGDHSLILYSPRTSDSGAYVCTVSNRYGSARAQLELRVEPSEETVRRDEIRVQVTPKTKSVSVGASAEFVCSVNSLGGGSSGQEPLLWWSRAGGAPLPAHHSTNGNVLHLARIREEDAGRYQCTAQSADGSMSFDAAYLQISKRDPSSAFPVFIRMLETPTDSHQPTAEFRYGVRVTAECVAQTQDVEDVTWSKESGVNRAQFERREFNSNTMTIPALLAMDLGTYVCIATTRNGLRAQNSVVFSRSTNQNNQFTYMVKGPTEPVSESSEEQETNNQEQSPRGDEQGQEQGQEQQPSSNAEPVVEILGEKQIRTFEGKLVRG